MKKIYGYKERDVINLAEFIKTRKGESLSTLFERFASLNGKAKGTVRNLYYALVKASQTDSEFCQTYLEGKPLTVGKIDPFDGEEEKKLVKEILIAKKGGQSVRSKILSLANGNGKVALRYQNKFRNAIKNKPKLIEQIVLELKQEGVNISDTAEVKKPEMLISEVQFLRLKSEINSLVNRISEKTKKENEYLKERVELLERENLRLSNLLYGQTNAVTALKFFRPHGGENALN